MEFVTELDASDPGRVYQPLEPQAGQKIEPEPEQEGPELGGGGGATSWEDQQGSIDAAAKDAEVVSIEGQAEQAQVAELAAEDPTAGLNEAELATLQQVMGAMDNGCDRDNELER